MSDPVREDHPRSEPAFLSFDALRQAAECLRCIAHPHRLRIIEILLSGDYTVEEVANLCGLSQPATSGHLRLMQGKGFLQSRRRGRRVYYSVVERQLESILKCISARFSGDDGPQGA
ncbi:winged helix-turn-helix transcriptional regulator [Dissulfurirhabdus thermomarina]|uniref:Winged helix-turn-helix transcriptional regulator n=1 Tax=Dissulfurirhabdus thermomarina TaxID=1765737 RepID=A0A6N9TJZ8_DISTH|nr:metalloregulator ArsR/SmtB family transcription factor [Dissulfurirhabdus thermomarina]NDY41575.1 winged helix-turn-helix transcriptional regulator [Dissulfurirhabdus thermomarina]NMX22370.1 winged helix-turn-helix transcriptional regulator [Dissulfurirhabdus thermomarina]